MPRRIRKSTSLLSPASNFIKRLSNSEARSRRKFFRFGLWGLVILLGYSFMSGTYGVPRIIRLQLERSALVEANQELLVELIEADRIREMLKSSPQYIEHIARTKYHLVRPNEKVFRYHGQ